MRLPRACCCLAVVLVTLGLAACTGDEQQPRGDAPPLIVPGGPGEPAKTIPRDQVTSIPASPPNVADIVFMTRMVVHHQQALDMTELVPSRAESAMVKGVAARIADSQRPEIDAMKAWLRLQGHDGHTGDHGTMPGMATAAQLDALRSASGAAFDALFLQLMIVHHQGAVTMSHEIQNKGADQRVQDIADEVIAIQSAEINRMQGMVRQ